jgi:6-phosphogluconate dehydrogenase
MGMNMSRRLIQGKHEVAGYSLDAAQISEAETYGVQGVQSLTALVEKLVPPRAVWLMVPAGKPVDANVAALADLLSKEDIVIDGGNSYFKDDLRHSDHLRNKGIRFVDVGVSGGIWGLKEGYCQMVGGDRDAFERLEPIFKTLGPENGYLYCGACGSGHFVKMVHNGIEYGLMEAYGEGFEILKASPYQGDLDFSKVAALWNRGSVIRSWLLELIESAFSKDPELSEIEGFVEDSGEGRWTVQQAVETGVPAPVITESLFKRFRSRQEDNFGDRVVAALRREFGGHAVRRTGRKRSLAAGAGAVKAARADEDYSPSGQ